MPSLADWSRHLRQVAQPVLEASPRPAGFATGPLDPPLLAVLDGVDPGPAPSPLSADEIGLWWRRALDPGAAATGELLDRVRTSNAADRAVDGGGALLPRDLYSAIEVWTDAELAALHAWWWLAEAADDDDARAHLARIRDWHLEHTQPDNATNRPWAIHVFLLGATPEHEHYAATLLHNGLAMDGVPTPLGARLLRDAADAIDRAAALPAP